MRTASFKWLSRTYLFKLATTLDFSLYTTTAIYSEASHLMSVHFGCHMTRIIFNSASFYNLDQTCTVVPFRVGSDPPRTAAPP